jgi:hypothetical protein
MTLVRFAFTALAAVLFWAAPLSAQDAAGTITGRVNAGSGEPGACMEASACGIVIERQADQSRRERLGVLSRLLQD